jgi:hypothetical protein
MMAVNIPNDDYPQDPQDRNGSEGAQPQRNIRHTETAMPPTTEQDSKVMVMVLKALNDLKSDMETVKKILNISDGTKTADAVYPKHKPGYHVNGKREKTMNRFSGAIAKGTKVPKKYASSAPQPLTLRVVAIKQSDSDSEQSAQFAGIRQQYKYVVPDYRILTADHNETVLGGKCLLSFTKGQQHASAGNETEHSGFNSRHIEGPMRTLDSHRSTTTNDSLSDGFGQRFDNVISMSEIVGQDEVVDMPNDKVRIQTIMEERSTAQYNMMAIDQSTVICIKEPRMAKERQYMEQSPPPFATAPVATAPTRIPASTVSSLPSMVQCIFSPSAPQVEDYALDAAPIPSNLARATLMTDKQDGSVPP